MRVLIVGAGIVGLNLAEQLSREGHDISLLEKSTKIFEEVQERLDVLAICGDANSISDLRAARIEGTDMVVAVTNDDARNLLVCQIAAKFNIPCKIARVRNKELLDENSPLKACDLGIDKVINPETVTVNTVKQAMQVPGATDVANFAGGDILLCGFHINSESAVAGLQMSQIKKDSTEPFLIASIERDNKVIIPKGDERILARDHIFVLMDKDYPDKFLKLLGTTNEDNPKKVVILSASRLGQAMAGELENSIEKVILIEKNIELAQQASKKLTVHVVHGEVTDPEIVRAVGMDTADYFIALADDEEHNILSSLVAKKNGAKKVISLQRTDKYESLLHHFDIDMVLNPKQLTAGETLKYIRKGRIHAVTKLHESEAEVIELEAMANAPIVGAPLKSVKIPEGALIGAILRDKRMIIPTGESFIYPGETVVVFALPHAIDTIEKLFNSP